MGGYAFIGGLALSAALLGVWLDCRLGSRRPESPMRRFVHAGIAFVLLQVGTGVAGHVASPTGSTGQRWIAVFLLLLPSLVYAFLTALWLVRTLAEVARPAGR